MNNGFQRQMGNFQRLSVIFSVESGLNKSGDDK